MLQIFGWALRLLAYYQVAPSDYVPRRDAAAPERPDPAPPAPPPPPTVERSFQVGDRFRGTITRVLGTGHVFMALPDEIYTADGALVAIVGAQRTTADVVIPAERHSGKGMKVGNVRWVEVVEIHQQPGKLLLAVAPSSSPLKKDA
ncbi:MAG: hypothetical protein HC914_15800 [Chloroflexaceae bacterium]|nr:hypothetical protein [Chloroflexaceae bacterium]